MRSYILYNGNNIEILQSKQVKWRKKFRCIWADPPYLMSTEKSKSFDCRDLFLKKSIITYHGKWDVIPDGVDHVDYIIDHSMKWLKLCQSLLTDDGSIFVCGLSQYNLFGIVYAMRKLGYHILNNIYVYKPNAAPCVSGVRFGGSVEEMIWSKKSEKSHVMFHYHKMKQFNHGKQMRNLWTINNYPHNWPNYIGKRVHTTPKTDEQVRLSLLATTKRGDWVLDPFLGAGTTMRVAKKLGRNCIGIEIEKSYIPVIKHHVGWNQQSLNDEIRYRLVKKWR